MSRAPVPYLIRNSIVDVSGVFSTPHLKIHPDEEEDTYEVCLIDIHGRDVTLRMSTSTLIHLRSVMNDVNVLERVA